MNNLTCTRCVMDTSDSEIFFDNQGVCNHCISYDNLKLKYSRKSFDELIKRIKSRGRKYPYDCLVGISGGTDSSYMLHTLKNQGLRILAMNYDSGWNTPEAEHNIKALTESIGVELLIYKVDWNAFKNVQKAYLNAGVVDLDVPTDHALYASMYETAYERNIPTILSGHNLETESVMPESWVTDKLDSRNMRDICKKFGNGEDVSLFPFQTAFKKFRNYNIRKIETIYFLNYVDYNKSEATKILMDTYGWQPVRVKHGESIWTRFYQCYILPTRFGIDKRKAHFSNLILSGDISRDEAVQSLSSPLYLDDFETDKSFILEKYEISDVQFNHYMSQKVRKHSDFKNEKQLKMIYAKIRTFPFLKSLLGISTRH